MNDLPKRKQLRLKNYDYSSRGAYFVTICIQDRKPILSDVLVGDGAFDVPQIRLTKYGKIVEKYLLSSENITDVKIDQYVIMPDHIHAIIIINPKIEESNGTSKAPSPTNALLPHIVGTFKRFCSKEIGENIFQRSFSEHIIRDREDYLVRRKYIYDNPRRWYYKRIKPD